ncbi:DUF448 domain-containing protein [Actinosynnema mirum]|uniref:DUF448 domain-containing protein n=1 Tax=Actinosynnema mirum TaxID=40567 RepID=UPI0003228F56
MVRRQGPVNEHDGPVRTCVGCRARTSYSELLRVVAVAGALAPDPRRRLPGRGAWLHPDPSCLRTAEKRRAFPRALKVTGELDAEGVRAHLEQFGSTAAGSPRGRQQVKEAGRPVMSQP